MKRRAKHVRARSREKFHVPPELGKILPIVAIVGRPNVGKSTLFNRIVGADLAVVEDVEGVTRDRHEARTEILEKPCILVDTGGFDPTSEDPMKEGIVHHVEQAIEACDLVICVVDASVDPIESDRQAVHLLRSAKKPVIYVANKAESPRRAQEATSYYELGLEDLLPISALHGTGIDELESRIAEKLPQVQTIETASANLKEYPKIAIVGRPNAGKSSFINRILKRDQQLVDSRAGTTVDSIDTFIDDPQKPYILTDTAGIRRKRSKKGDVEMHSIYQAVRAIERSDVVILLIDAYEGPAEQDAKIAGLAFDRGRAIVIALNKMDLLSKEEKEKAIEKAKDVLSFIPWAKFIPMSVEQNRGTKRVIQAAMKSLEAFHQRVTTSQINRFFDEVLETHPPPTYNKRPVRLYFVTQAQTAPPTFIVVTNRPQGIHFSYQRYVINQIRKRFGFEGTPIRVFYRAKKRDE